MVPGVFLVVAAQLSAFDAANLALTTCGFAAHRSANEHNLGDEQFTTKLSSDCAVEIAKMRRAIIALDRGRGKTSAAAMRDADSSITDFHSFFKNQYARRAEDERKLRELQQAIEAEGKANAP
ncbi:MAG: hypothetical protein ABIW03_00015 [Sphingomicrobium sp.]